MPTRDPSVSLEELCAGPLVPLPDALSTADGCGSGVPPCVRCWNPDMIAPIGKGSLAFFSCIGSVPSGPSVLAASGSGIVVWAADRSLLVGSPSGSAQKWEMCPSRETIVRSLPSSRIAIPAGFRATAGASLSSMRRECRRPVDEMLESTAALSGDAPAATFSRS
eukprot:CAMPEP_0177628124 /NCGR_PEP_ID=MMETSP0419_2-20121207/31580_1 /TAXON_ID=582737 /ORGANISM="Tetraselmis sp., Strain GSL018" /LENGTH=164 /DNA_ID=CAMNT_0019129345 /DNA_START=663 /DNA_END=1157 /DNA_ORIENTATION=+